MNHLSIPTPLAILTTLILFTACDAPDNTTHTEATLAQAETDSAPKPEPDTSPRLTYLNPARDHTLHLDLDALTETLTTETITVDDPYYEKQKTFAAFPLADFISAGFELSPDEIATRDFLLRAADGYAVPVHGSRLLEPGGYAAFDDLDHPDGWELVGDMDVDPAPIYVVWTQPDQQIIDTHPRPWQLVEISIVHPDEFYAHATPGPDASSQALAGYTLFRRDCIVCHAVNRSGGRAGPEMNIPQNITEYRDPEFLRAYIQNPTQFRYSQMPAFPALSQEDLDHLMAYFLAMKDRKIDPNQPPSTSPNIDP